MKSALFVGCIGIIWSATLTGAGASGLPPCSQAEIEQQRREMEQHPEGIPFRGPGLTCEIQSAAESETVPRTARRDPAGQRALDPLTSLSWSDSRKTGIDRSDEPIWTEFPSGRSGYSTRRAPAPASRTGSLALDSLS